MKFLQQMNKHNTKTPIVLLGGGGHCKSCIDVIEQTGHYEILGILDPHLKIGDRVLQYEIIGTDDIIPELIKSVRYYFITVGQIKSPERRVALYTLIKSLKGELPVIVSPSAYVSRHSHIGEGTIIMHHVVVNAGSTIGTNCIINTKALIEHDASVGDHCHISTGAIINGGCRVGNYSFIGSGAVAVHETNIPERSFIRANALFVK